MRQNPLEIHAPLQSTHLNPYISGDDLPKDQNLISYTAWTTYILDYTYLSTTNNSIKMSINVNLVIWILYISLFKACNLFPLISNLLYSSTSKLIGVIKQIKFFYFFLLTSQNKTITKKTVYFIFSTRLTQGLKL